MKLLSIFLKLTVIVCKAHSYKAHIFSVCVCVYNPHLSGEPEWIDLVWKKLTEYCILSWLDSVVVVQMLKSVVSSALVLKG